MQVEYGVTRSTRKTIIYGETGTAVLIGKFPVGTQVEINYTTTDEFDNTNTLKVGTNLNDTRFFSSESVTSIGGKTSGVRHITTENDREVLATVSGSATTGAITITVDYTLPTNEQVSY